METGKENYRIPSITITPELLNQLNEGVLLEMLELVLQAGCTCVSLDFSCLPNIRRDDDLVRVVLACIVKAQEYNASIDLLEFKQTGLRGAKSKIYKYEI